MATSAPEKTQAARAAVLRVLGAQGLQRFHRQIIPWTLCETLSNPLFVHLSFTLYTLAFTLHNSPE
jgi:hypothetical protein